jgi:hypothetical protein
VVGGVGYRDGKGGAKADAVFCSLDSNAVVPISVHVHLSFAHAAAARSSLSAPRVSQENKVWSFVLISQTISTALI